MHSSSKSVLLVLVSFGTCFSSLALTEQQVRNHVCNKLERRFGLGPFFTHDLMKYEAHAQVALAVAKRSRQRGVLDDWQDREDVMNICKELVYRVANDVVADDLPIYEKQNALEKLVAEMRNYSDVELGNMLYVDTVKSAIDTAYNKVRDAKQSSYNAPAYNPSYNPSYNSMGMSAGSEREQKIAAGKKLIDDLAAKTNTDEYFSRTEKQKIVAAQKRSLETASESSLQKMTPELITHRLHQGFSGKAVEFGKVKATDCCICIDKTGTSSVKGCSNWHPNDFLCNGCYQITVTPGKGDGKCPICRAKLSNIE